MQEFDLGEVVGLRLRVLPAAGVASLILWAALIGLWVWQSLPWGVALALVATISHWLSAFVHHLGHAVAARRAGYPMSGIRFGTLGLLASSVYPADEPTLPARIHIQRALGGPLASAALTTMAGVALFALSAVQSVFVWPAVFFFFDNLLTFTLQAFVPFGFNDGSTLLHWLRRRD